MKAITKINLMVCGTIMSLIVAVGVIFWFQYYESKQKIPNLKVQEETIITASKPSSNKSANLVEKEIEKAQEESFSDEVPVKQSTIQSDTQNRRESNFGGDANNPDVTDGNANPAEQTIENMFDAGASGNLELFFSFFHEKVRNIMLQDIEKAIAEGYPREKVPGFLAEVINTLRVVGSEYLDSNHALIYVQGEREDNIGYFTYYVDKYDDGWYITTYEVKNEKKN